MITAAIAILVIVIYYFAEVSRIKSEIRSNIKKYGENFGTLISQRQIEIGMTKEMVFAAFRNSGKSEGFTRRKDLLTEVIYYDVTRKVSNVRKRFRYKVTFVNDKVTEFNEL